MRFLLIGLILACSSAAFGAEPALDQLNRQRAAKGLYPYIYDAPLQAGAEALAHYRAMCHIAGHAANDFQFCGGSSVQCTGCSAWSQSTVAQLGVGACEDYGTSFRYAGCGWETGSDGIVYAHLVLSNYPSGGTPVSAVAPMPAAYSSPMVYGNYQQAQYRRSLFGRRR